MKRRALAFAMALSVAMLFASCDGDTGPSKDISAKATPAAASDPAIREAVSAAPALDFGHTVHVTPAGLQPQSLASMCCDAVVFKNETASPISILFPISKIDSGNISPGATWQWVPPNPESVLYDLNGDANQAGHIQIESPGW